MTVPDDRELAVVFSQGSDLEARAALESLLERHEARLRGCARRFCGGLEHDAEDLFQEFAAHLQVKRRHFKVGLGAWVSWAIKVLRGCASGFRRKQMRHARSESVGDAVEAWAGSPNLVILDAWRGEVRRAFQECFDNLDAELGRAFLLKMTGEHTLEDMTAILGLGSISNAGRVVLRATVQLRECLSGKGFSPMDQ